VSERFSYDREAQPIGIVHLGLGAFHRAHQAVYTDAAMDAGDRGWAICGVSLRSIAARDQLEPQGGLYTVTERDGDGERTRLMGAIRSVLVGSEDPNTVMEAIASPATRVVTLTVTEKGYHSAVGGGLDVDAPDVADDLSSGPRKRTVFGFLADGLARRRTAGLPGLTLVSCDNLSNNGPRLAENLAQFLDVVDPALRRWFEDKCSAPATMVDRIVPATTPEQVDALEARCGFRDEAAVFTEPFSQWVIEDRFAGPRPRWEAGGAQFVFDVKPYEEAKLRMLNGAHSALAYLGLQRGHTYIHQAIADPRIRPLIKRLMLIEAAPTLSPTPELHCDDYAFRLLERFANPALDHRLDQIAMDGSQKIPQRWFPTLRYHQKSGLQCPAILESLAAWLLHVRLGPPAVADPLAETLATIWRDAGNKQVATALFGRGGLFASAWTATVADLDFLQRRLTGPLL